MKQARHDLAVAGRARTAGDHDWACYAAAQAGEKGLKAGLLVLGVGAVWGHDHVSLLDRLKTVLPPEAFITGLDMAARRLNRLQAAARYPIGESDVPPVDLFDADDAEAAIASASLLIEWIGSHVGDR